MIIPPTPAMASRTAPAVPDTQSDAVASEFIKHPNINYDKSVLTVGERGFPFFLAGSLKGNVNGYASVADAITAAQTLTAGKPGTVAAMALDKHTYHLVDLYMPASGNPVSSLVPLVLEDRPQPDIRIKDERVVALIDGETVYTYK